MPGLAVPPSPWTLSDVPEPRSRIAFSTIESRTTTADDYYDDAPVEEKDRRRFRGHRATSSTTTTPPATVAEVRDEIFELGAVMGRTCGLFLSFPRDVPVVVDVDVVGSVDDDSDGDGDGDGRSPRSATGMVAGGGGEGTTHAESDRLLGETFLRLFALSGKCGVDLRTCVLKKMELNGKKYPVELCKGKSGKYTNYSDHTGITTTVGQSTIDSPTKACTNDMEDDITVEGITLLIRNFANERQWYRYHTPRNIALAILGELGELAELFQWLGDGEGGIADEFSEEALDKVGQEIADVAIYLIRLCDVCGVRLGEVAMRLLDERS